MGSNLYLGGALGGQYAPEVLAGIRAENSRIEQRASEIAANVSLAESLELAHSEALEMDSARNEKQAEAEEKGPTAAETRAHHEHIQELREKYGDWGNDYGDNEPSEAHDFEGDE
jgi:hypothetical protein